MSAVALRHVRGAGTRLRRVRFASAQDLTKGRRVPLVVLEMRRPHGTNGIRAPIGQFWHSRSRSEVGTRTAV